MKSEDHASARRHFHYGTLALLGCLVMLLGYVPAGHSQVLYGTDGGVNELITLDTGTGVGTSVGATGIPGIEGLAYDSSTGTIYGSETAFDYLIAIDPATGVGASIGELGFDDVQGLAYDSNTDTLYGTDVVSDHLLTINTATGAATPVGMIGSLGMLGLAYDPNTDTLYGSELTGKLFTIDKASGLGTLVGQMSSPSPKGLAFDSNTDTLYLADPDLFVLLIVDTATGATTPVGDMVFSEVWGLAYSPVNCAGYTFPYTLGTVNPDLAVDLRQAITCANDNGTADMINLAADVTLTEVDNTADGNGSNSLPAITSEITINGNGFDLIRDGAAPAFRFFYQNDAAADLTLSDITLSNGDAGADNGGAVEQQDGSLTIAGCTFSGNLTGGQGGAIRKASGGQISVTGSTFTGNVAASSGANASGGAIRAAGDVTAMNGNTFDGNQALGGDNVSGAGWVARGGAVHLGGTVTSVSNNTFTGNTAQGGDGSTQGGTAEGGALRTNTTIQSFTNNIFDGNQAIGGTGGSNVGGYVYGGGAYLDSMVTSSNNRFVNNLAQAGDSSAWEGGPARGGGLLVFSSSCEPYLTTAIVNNTARGGNGATDGGSADGGGYYGYAQLINSTISGNTAEGGAGASGSGGDAQGGGWLSSGDDTYYAHHVTVAGNQAIAGAGTVYGTAAGGGIYIDISTSFFMSNSILADNTVTLAGGSATADDCGWGLNSYDESAGYNLIEAPGTCVFTYDPSDITGVDPVLAGLLASDCAATLPDGSCIRTMALAPGSPAIDAGSCAVSGQSVDQRGYTRPFDDPGSANVDDACDIGAFEWTDNDASGYDDGVEFTVHTTDDWVDANGGDCVGMIIADLPGTDTVTSLREAICAANGTPGSYVIDFTNLGGSPDLYTLAIAGTGEDAAATGDLDITDELTLIGNGQTETIIQAGTDDTNGIDRVFDVLNTNATFEGMTIRHGNNTGVGGGIRAITTGTVSLTNSTVSDNTCNGDYGGGIYNKYGTVNLTNSTVSGNTTSYSGGGIFNYDGATLNLTDSTVSGNTAVYGGGIYSDQATTNLTNSTVSGNTATSDGGGVFNYYIGIMSLTNSTVSGNAANNGGGLYSYSGSSTANLTNCTVTGNTATSDGGGIYNDDGSAVTLTNTIVANQLAGDDCNGSILPTSNDYNLDSDGTCNLIQPNDNSNSANANLGPLQLNAPGNTATHALLTGSDAVDAADDAVCSAAPVNGVDQRGVTRPQDGDDNASVICDIGAFELEGDPTIFTDGFESGDTTLWSSTVP